MDQQLEYAQMLEVPVSTVSVVKKKPFFKKKAKGEDDLKEQVVDSVNERMGDSVCPEDLTVPPRQETKSAFAATLADRSGRVLVAEIAAACLLAVGIFLTNVFMPTSAINTFIRSITDPVPAEAAYTDFELFPVVSALSDAEVSVSDSGVITFTADCAVYPVTEGEVAAVTELENGYSVEIAHTSAFRSVINGLTEVYCSVGDEVAGNVPVGYSDGSAEVSVSMYNGGEPINGYTLSGALPVWNS